MVSKVLTIGTIIALPFLAVATMEEHFVDNGQVMVSGACGEMERPTAHGWQPVYENCLDKLMFVDQWKPKASQYKDFCPRFGSLSDEDKTIVFKNIFKQWQMFEEKPEVQALHGGRTSPRVAGIMNLRKDLPIRSCTYIPTQKGEGFNNPFYSLRCSVALLDDNVNSGATLWKGATFEALGGPKLKAKFLAALRASMPAGCPDLPKTAKK